MAINKVIFPTGTTAPNSGDWPRLLEVIQTGTLKSALGNAVDVRNDLVREGAVFYIAGSYFIADADTPISGSAGNYAYVKLTVSGDIATASYVSSFTGISWSETYNGYYDTSNNLYIIDERIALAVGHITTPKTLLGFFISGQDHSGGNTFLAGGAVLSDPVYAAGYGAVLIGRLTTGHGIGIGQGADSGAGVAIGNSGSTLNGATCGDSCSSNNGGVIGSVSTTNDGGAAGYNADSNDGFAGGLNAQAGDGAAVGDGASSTGTGFAGGEGASETGNGSASGRGASASTGGAAGWDADATTGFAGGESAQTGIGAAGGSSSVSTNGGAFGNGAETTIGGSIGQLAKCTDGFAGGYQASALYPYASALGRATVATAANQIRLGTATETVLLGDGSTVTSDRRDKTDIEDNDLGLEFLNKVRTVKFRPNPRERYRQFEEYIDTRVIPEKTRIIKDKEGNKKTVVIKEEHVIEIPRTRIKQDEDGNYWYDESAHKACEKKSRRFRRGVIAQELEELHDTEDLSAVKHFNHDGNGQDEYAVDYNQFIPILIKSVQELSAKVESLEAELATLRT